jgi:hypothetical protein
MVWPCDICGATPCHSRSFCNTSRDLDRRARQQRDRARPETREEPEPCDVSVCAAIYLIKTAPERLDAWMQGRDKRIETIARERLDRYVFGEDDV